MRCIIQCAGRGSRFKERSNGLPPGFPEDQLSREVFPKHLFQIRGIPILGRSLLGLMQCGFSEFSITLNKHNRDPYVDYLSDFAKSHPDISISYLVEILNRHPEEGAIGACNWTRMMFKTEQYFVTMLDGREVKIEIHEPCLFVLGDQPILTPDPELPLRIAELPSGIVKCSVINPQKDEEGEPLLLHGALLGFVTTPYPYPAEIEQVRVTTTAKIVNINEPNDIKVAEQYLEGQTTREGTTQTPEEE